MLKEIKCDKLKKGIPNKTIIFRPGLNCVVGCENANSIGKSSSLLLVDFCFGGETYARTKDIIDHVGHHSVFFCFSFGKNDYRFERTTDDPDHYFDCDQNYQRIGEKKNIKEFNDFLKDGYFPSGTGGSFRFLTSGFMRIYGKKNYDPLKPLRVREGNDDADEVKKLESLCTISAQLKPFHAAYDEASKKKNTFSKAREYGFIGSSIKNKSQLQATESRLAELNKELERYIDEENLKGFDEEQELSQKDIDVQTEIRALLSEQGKIRYRLNNLKKMTGESKLMTEDDRRELQRLFPLAELEPVDAINSFQQKVIVNVNEEIETEKTGLEVRLRDIEKRLADLRNRIATKKIPLRASKDFLNGVYSRQEEIKKLQRQVEAYGKYQSLKADVKTKEEELARQEGLLLPDTERKINEQLEKMNDTLFLNKHLPPHIEIKSPKSYRYVTPNDNGEGSGMKGLILFDFSMLKYWLLPVVIHDTVLFNSIGRDTLDGLFRIYGKIEEKQIFVALSGTDSLKEDVKQVVNDCTVLRLGEGEETLYGYPWDEEKKG